MSEHLNSISSISVVIVNHKRESFLRSCLESVQAQTRQPDEIIVIDNASTDNSCEIIRSKFPSVILIVNESNVFFSKAFNQGIRRAKGEFIFCLNNDVILKPDYIEKIIKKIEPDETIGMCAGKILRFDKQTIDSTGQFVSIFEKPIERGYNKKDRGRYNQEEFVFGFNASAVCYRRSMFEDIKTNDEYFDEDFVIFYEDFDLNYRAHVRGWKARYVPSAVVYHYRGGTTLAPAISPNAKKGLIFPKLNPELQFHYVKNWYLVLIKNLTLNNFLRKCLFLATYDMMICCLLLVTKPRLLLRLLKSTHELEKAFEKRRKFFSQCNREPGTGHDL